MRDSPVGLSTCWGLLVRCFSAALPAWLLGRERRNRELRSRGKPPTSSQPVFEPLPVAHHQAQDSTCRYDLPAEQNLRGKCKARAACWKAFFPGDLPGGVFVSGIRRGKLRNKAEPCQASCIQNKDASPEKLPLPRFNRNRGSLSAPVIRQKFEPGL